MSFARTTALAAALTLTACGSTAAAPPTTGANDGAFAAPPPTGANDGAFAAPRPTDRAADPMGPAPVSGLDLRLGAPFTPAAEGPGALLPRDQSGVLAELQYNAGHLQRCWQVRASAARPGTIVIHAHIGADGLVAGQCVTEDTVGDPELLQCANDLIAMGRYPTLGDETVDVVFPLHFGGGAG